MADFDPLTVPKVMDQSVRRINDQGYPRQALLDYEQALQQWMQANTANTNTRLNLVSTEIDGAYAAVSAEATTRATQDGILASRIDTVGASVDAVEAAAVTETTARIAGDAANASTITTVSATANSALTGANNATASGAVYIAAKAAPSGASAAYGWHITAGGAFAGMEALALSGGGSAIGILADRFYVTDSGTAQLLLDYNGSAFVFGVPILLRSGTSGARQEITNENTRIYDANNVLRVAIGINI